MKIPHRGFRLAFALAAGCCPTHGALAGIEDYAFELVTANVRSGESAVISVRLSDQRTHAAVSGAVIFAQRIDMAPDGMETMDAPIEVGPSEEGGIYTFSVTLPMEGNWRLQILAKVQGEEGTLKGELLLEALP